MQIGATLARRESSQDEMLRTTPATCSAVTVRNDERIETNKVHYACCITAGCLNALRAEKALENENRASCLRRKCSQTDRQTDNRHPGTLRPNGATKAVSG